jgi:NhaP-type Na+/H+ or K+/H+ antiporter
MGTGSIQGLELVFLLLLLFVVAFGALAKKLQIPYPIVLVLAGLLLSFVPGTPRITLNPDVIFFVVLPPLLYSAAWLTSWREFSYNLVSILFLAFGLVIGPRFASATRAASMMSCCAIWNMSWISARRASWPAGCKAARGRDSHLP